MTVQTLPFSNLIEINRQSSIPIFKQVSSVLVMLIREGKLKPGFQLPATRDMASMLKLNRTTIVAAYDEMRAQGWLESIGRKGIFISAQLPVIKPRHFVPATVLNDDHNDEDVTFYKKLSLSKPIIREAKSFQVVINDGYPDHRIAPMDSIYNRHRDLIHRSYLHSGLMAQDSGGSFSLRSEIALFLSKTRALDIDSRHVLVTHGAQLAIAISASMVLKPGSKVIVANLNYILADRLFEQLGATLIKVDIDQDGIDVDAIEAICKTSTPDLLYIIPHHHHPTTVTLSAERRLKLMQIIREFKLPVIEDDYDYDFHYNHSPILPLASGEHHGYVLYIGSISKTLSPTVRMGYIVGSEDFILQASNFKQLMEIRGDTLFEEAIAHLYKTGEMHRHIRRSVKLYKERRDKFCEILNSAIGDVADFNIPQGGMAVWTRFDRNYSIPELATRLASKGVQMSNGSLFKYGQEINGIRLGFASLNIKEMELFEKALKNVK